MDRIMFINVILRNGTQVSKTVKGEYVLDDVLAELIGPGNRELVASIVELEIMPQCRTEMAV